MQVRDTPLRVNEAGDTVTVAVGAGGSGVYYGPYRDKDALKSQGTLAAAGSSFSISTPVWVVSQGGRDGTPGDVQITSDVSRSSGVTVLHNGTSVTNPNFIDVLAADLVGIGMDYGLRPTADLDANYSATFSDYAVFNPTADGRVLTLPGNSSVVWARCGVLNRTGSGHNVTVNAQTPDVFQVAGGAASRTIVPGQWEIYKYDPSRSVWVVEQQGVSKAAMDVLYAAAGAAGGGYTTERAVQSPGSVLESMSRNSAVNTAIAITSGAMRLVLGTIPAGKTLSTLTAVSGTTAAVTPTNQWMAVFRKSDGVFLSATDDKTTAAWAASTAKTFTLVTPQAGGTNGLDIAIAIMVAAATPPSLHGANVSNVISGLGPVLSWNVGVGMTTPTSSNITMPVATGSGQTPFYVAGS